ncbi:hypothetical protein CF112_14520 [Aeromonas hydrophila]|nr:hypothetical protein CF112_14520 [Aeromonas hydrophila]
MRLLEDILRLHQNINIQDGPATQIPPIMRGGCIFGEMMGYFLGHCLQTTIENQQWQPTAVLETLVCMDLVERYHFQMIILIIKPI